MEMEKMTKAEYTLYVEEECERQWNECQKPDYGSWDEQDETTKNEYRAEIYALYIDRLSDNDTDSNIA